MSLPLFLLEDLSADTLTLDGAEGRHAATVRRLQPGEQLELSDGRGNAVRAVVLRAQAGRLQVRVVQRRSVPEPVPWLVLVQALAKGERGELAVELATEVGVDEIVPWAAARCVTRWEGERGLRALQRWRSTAREAGKQARRPRHPLVGELHSTAQLLARAAQACTLVLHERAEQPLAGRALPAGGHLMLVVGPEGGVTDEEVHALAGVGAVAVRLGDSVLRTSTAGAAAAAVVSAATGRWC